MHFSIPDTEEFSGESGSTYMVRSVIGTVTENRCHVAGCEWHICVYN